jgi:hypothetical protein
VPSATNPEDVRQLAENEVQVAQDLSQGFSLGLVADVLRPVVLAREERSRKPLLSVPAK